MYEHANHETMSLTSHNSYREWTGRAFLADRRREHSRLPTGGFGTKVPVPPNLKARELTFFWFSHF